MLTTFQERESVLNTIANEAYFFLTACDLDDMIIYVDYEGRKQSCVGYDLLGHARKYSVSKSTILKRIDRGRYIAAITFVRLMFKNPGIDIPEFLFKTFPISSIQAKYVFEDVKSKYDIYPERMPEGLLKEWD